MIIPHSILLFPQARIMTYLTTHVKKEERRRDNIYTLISIFYFFCFFKQVIAQKIK